MDPPGPSGDIPNNEHFVASQPCPSKVLKFSTERNPRNRAIQDCEELFNNAKTVRLRSHHDKYLFAEEDEESVTQSRNGSSKNAHWTVELVYDDSRLEQPVGIRLKSCYGKYLTGSRHAFLLGATGHKVVQSMPGGPDGSWEWEPVRESGTDHVRLKTHDGRFLRANGGVPPWRNSVTHNVPFTTGHKDLVVWDVDVIAFLDYHT